MSKVGFIGVGTMGCPMAANIVSKGNGNVNDLTFYDPYVLVAINHILRV